MHMSNPQINSDMSQESLHWGLVNFILLISLIYLFGIDGESLTAHN